MNQLATRSLDLSFISNECRDLFEGRVLSEYVMAVERSNGNPRAQVPHLADGIFPYVLNQSKDIFVAAYLNEKHQDPMYFINSVKGLGDRELYLFLKETMDRYNMHIEGEYDDLFYDDMRKVMEHHHICYIDVGYEEWSRVHTTFYRNLPISQVW